jgi:hypothetical protein
MSTLGIGKNIVFAATILGNIRVFALWGILDALVYLLAKDSRIKSILIYVTIFITLSVLAFYSPSIIEYL